MVVDGEVGKWYAPDESIDYISEIGCLFSPDSQPITFTATIGDKDIVVIDGNEGRKYDEVGYPIFSPDSQRVAYVAQEGDKWFVVIDGLTASGFGEEKVKLSRLEDAVSSLSGADGEVVRILSNDRRGLITITLLPNAAFNLTLSAKANLDALTGGGVFTVAVKNNLGLSIYGAPACWIRRIPEVTVSKGIDVLAWEIEAADLAMVHGGITAAVA